MLEHSDPAQGKLTPTGNPLDLAIGGAGFFELRDGDGFVYSRQGQFHIDADGRVVTAQGLALQDAEGGDLVLDHARVTIAEDGTVLDGERPIARIAVKLPAGGDAASAIGDRRLAAGRSRWADG